MAIPEQKKRRRKLHRNPTGAGLKNKFPVYFRVDEEKYEFLARLAHDQPSLQQTLHSRILGRRWKNFLEKLRAKQRAKGIPDTQFLHPDLKKKMGMDVKPGRRPLRPI